VTSPFLVLLGLGLVSPQKFGKTGVKSFFIKNKSPIFLGWPVCKSLILMQLNSSSPKIAPLRPELIENIPKVRVMPPDLSKYHALMHMGGDR